MAAGKGITKTLVWILMGMLILGLGGFGVTSLSGTIRSVGSVGDTDIDVNEYARSLRNEIRAAEAQRGTPISFAQAQAMGIDTNVLSQLVARAALDDETSRMGISIGDANLREEILEIPNFQGADGNFDRDAYSYTLEQTGMTEARFEDGVRRDTSRTLLQGAVVTGVNAPAAFTDTLINYIGERRNVTWAMLDRSDLATGLSVPTEEELLAYHSTHLSDFTSPEIRQITYAWLTPDMLLDSVEVDQSALQATYDDRLAEFNQPERRLVERLAFADAAAAEDARARLDAGDDSFETLVEARGLELADIDLGDVVKSELDGAGDTIFAADVGDIVGPLDSPIGPALFRINAVLSEQITSFEEAEPELRAELASDRARRVIDAQIENIEDLLAGGATLEDLAAETDMELGQIDWHDATTEDIAGYEAFRQAAATVSSGDYPQVLQLDDDGIFALRLNEIVRPTVRPLEQAHDQVVQGWRTQATQDALRTQVEAQLPQLQSGTSFEDIGMTPQEGIELTRNGFQQDTPPEFLSVVFRMEKGDIEVLGANGRVFVLRLDDIMPVDASDEDATQLRTLLQDQTATSISQDIFQALANDIRGRAGINLNQQALNAVHANFQ